MNQESQPVQTPAREAAPGKTQTPPILNWAERQGFLGKTILRFLEKISLKAEYLVDKIVQKPELNPFYHTGTLTVFLLLVILFTGIYLTMFYQFGFEASYRAVGIIEASFVGRIVRALHRYASGLVVITALLHGWKTFYMDRFRGSRWLAWVTGVVSVIILWLVGVTGYWLVWDERAQIITQIFAKQIGWFSAGAKFLLDFIIAPEAETGWVFVLIIISIHLGLSILIGVFFYYHISRLSRAKIMPPSFWNWLILAVLLMAAILLPAGNLPPMNPTVWPGEIPLDAWYLTYLTWSESGTANLIWGALLLASLAITALPWLTTRIKTKPIQLIPENCTGCTLCARDCPYQAIEMVLRPEGARHKFIAQISPEACVGCGICIGSCTPLALQFEAIPPDRLWTEVKTKLARHPNNRATLVFTCERHAFQDAKKYVDQQTRLEDIEIIPLSCIGMAHPDLAKTALEAGAAQVHFVGCPPEDCANREGNLWMEERLRRERLPKLKLPLVEAPIAASWRSPAKFWEHTTPPQIGRASAYGLGIEKFNFRTLLPALLVLTVIVGLQLALTYLPFTPNPNNLATLQIAIEHEPGRVIAGAVKQENLATAVASPPALVLWVDETPLWTINWDGASVLAAYEQVHLPAGTHTIRLLLTENGTQNTLFADTLTLAKRQILPLQYADLRTGADPERGRKLFQTTTPGTNAGCKVCHSLEENVVIVGPSFYGIATTAATRIEGMSAEAYLKQSIIDPNAYIVAGFYAGQMPTDLKARLTEEQIDDLVAFLLTLEEK